MRIALAIVKPANGCPIGVGICGRSYVANLWWRGRMVANGSASRTRNERSRTQLDLVVVKGIGEATTYPTPRDVSAVELQGRMSATAQAWPPLAMMTIRVALARLTQPQPAE